MKVAATDTIHDAEGVTKFTASHTDTPIPTWLESSLEPLLQARKAVFSRGWIGQIPGRYHGLGYGNISIRVGPTQRPKGQRSFVVSGTQTSGFQVASVGDFAWIREYDVRRNWVLSQGATRPSSESMTHGTLYDFDPDIHAVIHAHWPQAWQARFVLGLPTTPADVAYGTADMARATERLFETTSVATRRVYAMGGHLDGIVSFGETVEAALQVLIDLAEQIRV